METTRFTGENRGFFICTGIYKKVEVSVCSTGIGGPSASIVLEELIKLNAETFIRVGSAGGRQPDIPIGTPVIITAAYRGDGTSTYYLPAEFPAVADWGITNALVHAARQSKIDYRMGIGYTRDAFYARDKHLDELLKDAGVVAAEQEAATLFVVGSLRHAKVGAIAATDSNIWLSKQPTTSQKDALLRQGEAQSISVALEAIKILAERE